MDTKAPPAHTSTHSHTPSLGGATPPDPTDEKRVEKRGWGVRAAWLAMRRTDGAAYGDAPIYTLTLMC
ncbi:hypothetical protein V490_05043 [Pseudogymnoascus sp. VKM F-3557]|nr:hypothetical protein V490_05043 [Pseudogymnoascus sp. VKM F-3557]